MTDKYAALRPRRKRQCYRADRVPKKRYSRLQARATAALSPGYHAYRCPECGRWHVGHKREQCRAEKQAATNARGAAAAKAELAKTQEDSSDA